MSSGLALKANALVMMRYSGSVGTEAGSLVKARSLAAVHNSRARCAVQHEGQGEMRGCPRLALRHERRHARGGRGRGRKVEGAWCGGDDSAGRARVAEARMGGRFREM